MSDEALDALQQLIDCIEWIIEDKFQTCTCLACNVDVRYWDRNAGDFVEVPHADDCALDNARAVVRKAGG